MTKLASAAAYLDGLTPEKRAALERLRRDVLAVAPEAEDAVYYGMPAFRLGRPLICYAAAADHCAIYPMSDAVMKGMAADLAGYDTGRGTIRFPTDKPLPKKLVAKIIKAKIAETAERDTAQSVNKRRR